jgi:hypothetical protein
VTRSGTRSVLRGLTITLQARRSGTSTWATACTVRTSTTGQAACTVRPSSITDYRWVFNGSGNQTGANGGVTRTYVRTKVSARANHTSVRRGTTVKFTGSVAPRKAGARVYLQRYSSKKWRNVTSAKLSSKSAYSISVRQNSKGTQRYRIVTLWDTTNANAWSPTVTVRVR